MMFGIVFAIPAADWPALVHVEPGQPFCLDLWKLLLQSMQDPDVGFLMSSKLAYG